MLKKIKNKKSGFSLIESLIYIAILSTMAAIVVSTLLITARSYNGLKKSRNINNSAITSLERMTRDIKSANDIVITESAFDIHPGRLTVQSSATSTEFYLDNGALKVKENSIDTGSLTHTGVLVDSLIFKMFDNGISKAVRIEMDVSIEDRGVIKTKKFYSTAVLRN